MYVFGLIMYAVGVTIIWENLGLSWSLTIGLYLTGLGIAYISRGLHK